MNKKLVLHFFIVGVFGHSLVAMKENAVIASQRPMDIKLHEAADKNDMVVGRDCLQQGADVNARNRNAQTPMHIAWTPEFLKLLLDAGGQIEARDVLGTTPLDTIAFKGCGKAVTFLIESGAQINAHGNDGGTPLHTAVIQSERSSIKALLEKHADIHAIDIQGSTPLHYAAIIGDCEIIQLLLGHDANPNARMIKGLTPLQVAEIKDNEQAARILSEAMRKSKEQ